VLSVFRTPCSWSSARPPRRELAVVRSPIAFHATIGRPTHADEVASRFECPWRLLARQCEDDSCASWSNRPGDDDDATADPAFRDLAHDARVERTCHAPYEAIGAGVEGERDQISLSVVMATVGPGGRSPTGGESARAAPPLATAAVTTITLAAKARQKRRIAVGRSGAPRC
jgi:hypothetical protein